MRTALALVVPCLLVALSGCTGTDGGDPTPDRDPDDPDDGRIDPGTGGDDQAWDQATNASFPGLVLDGTMDQYDLDGNASVTASVRNDGDEEYKVSAICTEPWSDTMARGDADLFHREPTAQCEAFGLKAFEDDSRVFSWNRTLWHEDADGSGRGEYRPAEDGAYTWRIHFAVYKGGDESYEFEDYTVLTIEFQADV